MTLALDVQYAVQGDGVPGEPQIRLWAEAALKGLKDDAEMTVRITDAVEITELNSTYRHKNYATNVLSFPADLPEELGVPLLGDVVVCSEVVAREAAEQNKTLEAHWAHMIVHGTLHLLGYDHINDEEAVEMEGLESRILTQLGYQDPYS